MSNVETATISLPKPMARRARALSRAENRTVSELFREAFRKYESSQIGVPLSALAGRPIKKRSWDELQTSLKRISRAGKGGNLSKFVIADRQRH